MKQLLGVFQIPEESKYQIEAVLNDFNADRPFRYRLSFSRLYRSLVDRFLGDPEFRSDLLAAISSSQIPIPVLTCPHCDSTEGFYLVDPPSVIRCNKCTRTFRQPKELREYEASKQHLSLAKSKLSGVTDFEEIEEIRCKRCGASESEMEIPEITSHLRDLKVVNVKCKNCGFIRNEFGKLKSREEFSKKTLRARQRLRALDPKNLGVDENG